MGELTLVINVRCLILTLFLALLFVAVPSFANQFDEAATLYDQKKYVEARKRWENAGSDPSENGASFFRIAQLYQNGLGHKEHHGRAAYWYQQSAEKAYVPAMYQLGLLHHRLGDETVRNIKSAVLWWEKAAAKGHGDSQMELAKFYSSNKKDTLQALKFARAAAAQNIPESLKLVRKIEDAWVREAGSRSYTVELYRTNSRIDAQNLINKIGLTNAAIYQTNAAESVVITGEFDSFDQAQEVSDFVPQKLGLRRSTVVKFSEVQAELADLQLDETEVRIAVTDANDANDIPVSKPDLAVSKIEQAVTEREIAVAGLEQSVSARELAVSKLESAIFEQQRAVAAKELAVSEREFAASKLEPAIAEQEQTLAARELAVSERELAVSKLEPAIAEQERAVAAKELAVSEREVALSKLEPAIACLLYTSPSPRDS